MSATVQDNGMYEKLIVLKTIILFLELFPKFRIVNMKTEIIDNWELCTGNGNIN